MEHATLFFAATDYRIRAVFDSPCDKCADVLAHLFSSFGDQFLRGAVQIANDPIRKTFPWSAAFPTVPLLSHSAILILDRGKSLPSGAGHHVSTPGALVEENPSCSQLPLNLGTMLSSGS